MVRRVCDSANHDPCPGTWHNKKFCFGLPPGAVFRSQRCEPLSAVFRVTLHKFQSSLGRGQWRRANVNSEHADKPQVFTHALMHHLFAHAAPSRVPRPWAHRKIRIPEFAPHANDLDALGFVRFNKKFVSHRAHPCTRVWGTITPSRRQSRQFDALDDDADTVLREQAQRILWPSKREILFPENNMSIANRRVFFTQAAALSCDALWKDSAIAKPFKVSPDARVWSLSPPANISSLK